MEIMPPNESLLQRDKRKTRVSEKTGHRSSARYSEASTRVHALLIEAWGRWVSLVTMEGYYTRLERLPQRRKRYRPKRENRVSPCHVIGLTAMSLATLMAFSARRVTYGHDKLISPTIDVSAGSRALLRDLFDREQPRSYVSSGTIFPVGEFKPLGCGGSQRCEKIMNATRRVWDAYESNAFGEDEVSAISGSGRMTALGGLGATIVDSLDTLYIMGGLEGRYERAREWVDKRMNMHDVKGVSVFETVIRILGGCLSQYHLSGDEMYMLKAEELGARLAPAFNTPRQYPCGTLLMEGCTACKTSFRGPGERHAVPLQGHRLATKKCLAPALRATAHAY